MRLIPSDPDIETIIGRINKGDINLQPDFQRGEVWGEMKKVKLIDSVLRDWHIPPIHVVEIKESGKQDVLDGQQRLVAIRDFVNCKFSVNGNIEPFNDEINKIDGYKYNELPEFWKRKFDKFTIRIYSITDYLPSEPGELFYRLNQPTNLTSAEQRNAFYGPAREQVKDIVNLFNDIGLTREQIGFSNSRMAYEDVIARLCSYIEFGNMREKITSNLLADRFRSETGFSKETINRAKQSVTLFGKALTFFERRIKFNKATLLSWLLFLTKLDYNMAGKENIVGNFIYDFENCRSKNNYHNSKFSLNQDSFKDLLEMFTDRSSSRVADVSSVLIRDVIISLSFYSYENSDENFRIEYSHELSGLEYQINNRLKYVDEMNIEDDIYIFIEETKWGFNI